MTGRPDGPARPAGERGPVTWFACAGCGTRPADGAPVPLVCPAAVAGDDIDHVLVRLLDPLRLPFPTDPDPNPFVRYRTLLHGYHVARGGGSSDGDITRLIERAAELLRVAPPIAPLKSFRLADMQAATLALYSQLAG